MSLSFKAIKIIGDLCAKNIDTMVGTKHQVSFSNKKHLVIGCQVCQPTREEEIKTLLFSDWFTDLTTNHKVLFRTKHGMEK